MRKVFVKIPVQDGPAAHAGRQRAIRAIVPAIATAQWTFAAELLGAVRRRHRQLAVDLSIHLDPGLRRFKRTNGLLLEPDMRPDPVERKAYGGKFLTTVKNGLEANLREEIPRIHQAGDWLANSHAVRGRIFRNLQGHLPPGEAGRPGDADFFSNAKPISLTSGGRRTVGPRESPLGRHLSAAGLPGKRGRRGGSRPCPRAPRTIFIHSRKVPAPNKAGTVATCTLIRIGPRSDACLSLDGYDVKACPLSAILGLSCYYAICDEVDSHAI